MEMNGGKLMRGRKPADNNVGIGQFVRQLIQRQRCRMIRQIL